MSALYITDGVWHSPLSGHWLFTLQLHPNDCYFVDKVLQLWENIIRLRIFSFVQTVIYLDGANVFELVGSFILNKLTFIVNKSDIGLYRLYPPFSRSVRSNIGIIFSRLLSKHFPRNHTKNKIFDRNTVKQTDQSKLTR